MPSVIEICNLALSAIGQGVINALDEASPQAEACSLHYENARDSVLREFPWNFATQTVQLAQTTRGVQGWDYVYQYPANVLWVRKVFQDGRADKEIPDPFEVITIGGSIKYIACDLYQAYAKVTARITDPVLFDPLFAEVLTYKLALKLAMPLTNSGSKTQELTYHYQQAAAAAKLAGAVEGPGKKPESQRPRSSRAYINARR